jgi:UDP-N-acetylglucosamine 1-carboxyvinyltransferase
VIGSRPLDVHFVGFRMLGARVERRGSSWFASAPRLTGARVFFDYPSVLGTVNVLLAAVLAEGTTVVVNAAPEPEVEMLARMLISMGARITGHGTPVITVEGVERLGGTTFSIIPDRLEAGTYLLAGAATGGDVHVTNADPAHLDSLVAKLREMGMEVDTSNGVRARHTGKCEAVQVQAVPYPGFATDLHPPMAAALTQAKGVSLIHERVYDNRTLYVNELRKLGARIITSGDTVIIEGPTALGASTMRCLDIRAGAAAVVAALAAEGESTLLDIHHLDRGYSDLQGRLRRLGATIERR